MGQVGNFKDGIVSLFNQLANRRNASNANTVYSARITDHELTQIYKTGLGNKIARIKSGYSLNDSLIFESKEDEIYYKRKLAVSVKKAALWMFVYGRGIVVLHNKGDDLSTPLTTIDRKRLLINVFSGDQVSVPEIDRDLNSEHYFKPKRYLVRGYTIHPSRVVDLSYVPLNEDEAPQYQYGGISEFELIYNQIINDGIVERSSAQIVEKNSSLFYKVKDFKSLVQSKQEDPLIKYFSLVEDRRSVYGAGIIDGEDEVVTVNQQMTNLSEVDQITLRRLAMVTGIPLAILVGENVKGLNSTGDNEMETFWTMIDAIQDNYLYQPLNDLMEKLGMGAVEFKENHQESPAASMEYETKAIDNAVKLASIGEDYGGYLEEKGIVQPDNFDEFFKEPEQPSDQELAGQAVKSLSELAEIGEATDQ